MNTIYDVDYFIKKFEAIADEFWLTEYFSDEGGTKHCTLGHCDWLTNEVPVLRGMFFNCLSQSVATINDGNDARYQQPTPKQRILAALRDIKAKQQPKEIVKVMVVDDKPLPERIVYVTVDKEVRELQKVLRDN